MESNANRWMATALLLAMFGIIAYAGTRSTVRQTSQNVLVTNNSSQPVPIPARPGSGAYIVSVANAPSVKVVNSGDSTSADIAGFLDMTSNQFDARTVISIPAASPVIIDSVSLNSTADTSGESVHLAWLEVHDSQAGIVSEPYFVMQALSDNPFLAVYSSNFRVFVPKGGSVFLNVSRSAATAATSVQCWLTYHTVPM